MEEEQGGKKKSAPLTNLSVEVASSFSLGSKMTTSEPHATAICAEENRGRVGLQRDISWTLHQGCVKLVKFKQQFAM